MDARQTTTTSLNDTRLAVRHAQPDDKDAIIQISQRVQDSLTANGSLQHIGPLDPESTFKAIAGQQCYVLESEQSEDLEKSVIGCALMRHLEPGYFAFTSSFSMESFARPWLYLHSIMLEPNQQGRGIGVSFVSEVVEQMALEQRSNEGTIFLDCWAGNEKLGKFYTGVGFQFAAVVPEEDYEIAVFHRPLYATDAGQ